MTHDSLDLTRIPPEPAGESDRQGDDLQEVPTFAVQTATNTETSGDVIGDPPEDAPDDRMLPYPVVAIGASAGGIEAYLQLFDSVPDDTGMAFVLVPHLSREHESHLVEILKRHTRMPVSEVQHGVRPEPNNLYILPPNKWARMEEGKFSLEARPPEKVPRSIDYFFRSLAADQRSRAIGIILSGLQADGALGLADIKGEGGISIVQAPSTAQYPDLPKASIAADHVDLILSPSQMGGELARLARQLARPDLPTPGTGASSEGNEQDFLRILTLLQGVSGIQFRRYKPGTLRRRIFRRMLLERIESLGDYANYLQSTPRELRDLQEDVLINATRFFRDPDVFQSLKNDILPRLLEKREPGQQIRIWVAGCSTGEEVYSIAICIQEFLSDRSSDAPVQVFGTDASELSIGKARSGIYPETSMSEVSPERLRRFFTKLDKGYQVAKRIRDLCIFARQNLCVDPPFSRLDLVSCRNVLIYFGTELRNHAILTFHYSLQPNGYLLLGASESIRGYTRLFQQVDRQHKFSVKVDAPLRLHLEPMPHLFQADLAKTPPAVGGESWADLDLQRMADRIVIARYGPPGVVINEKLEILQSRGHTRPFLEMSPGAASLQLLRMVRDNIVAPLREAVQRAIQLDVPVRVDHVEVEGEGNAFDLAVEVLPIPGMPGGARCLLVLFVAKPRFPAKERLLAPEQPGLPAAREEKDAQILRLRQDLESSRIYLQALLDDRDAKNQELISANEEIQSANEELQSTNEELETTKEELQSTNEELQTVNEELRHRNSVLTQATNDLSNLFNSVHLPVLILNGDLNIRHFTPPTQRLINVRPSDVGRPVTDIRMNFDVENLDQIFKEVLENLTPRELEVRDRDGHWHLLRVRPYRTAENKIDGLVVVMVDVDQLRRGQQELRDARDYARSIIENVPLPLAVLNLDLRVLTVNDALRALAAAQPRESFEGRMFLDLAASRWGVRDIRPHLDNLKNSVNGSTRFEIEHEIAGEERRVFRVAGCLLQPDHERLLLVTIQDVTAQAEAQRRSAAEREQLAKEVQSTTQQLGRTQEELRALAGRLFQSQEDERRRVARELHDDVSQKLALLANDGKLLEQGIANDPRAKQALGEMTGKVAELSETVRGISHRIHPSVIEDLGLSVALKHVVEEFGARENMPVTFARRGVPAHLPLEIATNLYRIAQEALRNVSKYAGKTHLKVSLTGKEDEVELEIADFGEGFDPQAGRPGLGLVSMEERARLIGGTFSVDSAPGRGTRVSVRAPLPKETELA